MMPIPSLALVRMFAVSLPFLVAAIGCSESRAQKSFSGVRVAIAASPADFDAIAEPIDSANRATLKGPGMVGVRGGVRVKALKTGRHELLLPLPQQVDSQVPLAFGIHSPSHPNRVEFHLQQREGANEVVAVTIEAERGDTIALEWAAVVLLGSGEAHPREPLPQAFSQATACAQADAPEIKELAVKLWPANGSVEDYARRIQEFVQTSQQRQPPRSLDALGILASGNNFICTANANLAVALLRAKGVAARSLAVIPPTNQRIEMHRVVEFESNGHRQHFDPSSLHTDVPMRPWQTVIMAQTSVADENAAMRPRMGVSLGCPYGQEAEFTGGSLTFDGPEFFWTVAKPLAEFDPGKVATAKARDAWRSFLQRGVLASGQRAALKATSGTELAELLLREQP